MTYGLGSRAALSFVARAKFLCHRNYGKEILLGILLPHSKLFVTGKGNKEPLLNNLWQWNLTCTVNPLYNDIRYNSKIRYNVNLVCTKSADRVSLLIFPCYSSGKHRFCVVVRIASSSIYRHIWYTKWDSDEWSWRDPLKHFETSVLRHIIFSEFIKIQIAQQSFTNEYVIRLLQLEIYIENIVGKGRNCSWGAISLRIHNILLPDVRFLSLNKDQIFSSR